MLDTFREVRLLAGLTSEELLRIAARLAPLCRKVCQGEVLFRAGDPFDAVYEVRSGFFKTLMTSLLGVEQVTGFRMAGELLGLDGIGRGRHDVDAIALEDSQVWALRYEELTAISREVPPLQEQLHRQMGREIASHQATMLQLGSMYSEERMAAFLLDLMHRLAARGFSPTCVQLRIRARRSAASSA